MFLVRVVARFQLQKQNSPSTETQNARDLTRPCPANSNMCDSVPSSKEQFKYKSTKAGDLTRLGPGPGEFSGDALFVAIVP